MPDPRLVLNPPLYVWGWRLSLALYALAFVLPLGRPGPWSKPVVGWQAFQEGLMGWWDLHLVPWWANPVYWAALHGSRARPNPTSFVMAFLASVLAVGVVPGVAWAGAPRPELGPAYWAWASSMGLLAAALGIALLADPPPPGRPGRAQPPVQPRLVLARAVRMAGWGVSLALYALSFALPFNAWNAARIHWGWEVFGGGLMRCGSSDFLFWWANPLFWLGLAASWKEPKPLAIAGAALGLAFAAALPAIIMARIGVMPDLGPGYWAWTASMGILALAVGASLLLAAKPGGEDEGRPGQGSIAGPPGDERVKQAR